MAGVIGQILLLDPVFSLDSIIAAVGMTDDIPIMVIAVLVAVSLLMIGGTLLADGVGVKIPKGYIYAAMAFSAPALICWVGGLPHSRSSRRSRPQFQR